MSDQSRTPLSHSRWLTFLSLTIITLITYLPTRHFPFNFDDLGNITEKFNIRTFNVWQRMLTSRRWFGEWLNALIFQLDGFAPHYYRLCNIGTHLLSGALVYLLTNWLCKRSEAGSLLARQRHAVSALTTGLFLLHPVQTQTISYAIQGKLEGVASVLMLLSLYSMLQVLTDTRWYIRIVGTTVGLVSGIVACGTKEIAIVAPALLLLLDWFFIAKQDWSSLKKRLLWHGFYGATIGAIMVYYFKPRFFLNIIKFKTVLPNNRGNMLTATHTGGITPYLYCISQFKVLIHYLAMFIWPFGISVEYDWLLAASFFSFEVLMPLLVLAGIVGFSLKRSIRTSYPYLTFGILWFLVTMAPRTSIIPSHELVCDYKTYLASIGWLLLIAAGMVCLLEYAVAHFQLFNRRQAAYYSLLCCTTLGLATSTYHRNQVWSSGEAFWLDVVHKAPNKARGHNNYGVELVKTANQLHRDGKSDEANTRYAQAIQSYKQALLIEPHYADAYSNLSVAYTILDEVDKAIEVATQAIKLFPDYPEAHMNLGTQYLEKKEYAKAEEYFKNAVSCRAHYGKAYYNLARAYQEQGKHEESWEALVKASKSDFDRRPECWLALGQACLRLNKTKEAIEALEQYQVVDITPTPERQVVGATFLANAYQLDKQLNKAANIYIQLAQHFGNDNKHWHNLAECFFSNNQYQDALKYFDRASRCPNAGVQTHVRLAHCYEKMNQHNKAAQVMNDIIHAPNAHDLPAEVLVTCKNELQRINAASVLAQRLQV